MTFDKAKTKLKSLFAARTPIDDGLKVVTKGPTEFRYHQVEPLLAQTATLLERGIASRSEWNTLGEKSFSTFLELKEFVDLEAIHSKETHIGYYALPTLLSYSAYDAEDHNYEANLDATAPYWIRFYPDNRKQFYPGPRQNEPLEQAVMRGQANLFSEQAKAAEMRRLNFDFQGRSDLWNVEFRRKRTEAARRVNALKTIAFTEPGGAFNYEERRAQIQKRFQADFNDAMSRLAAVKQGLNNIYGYSLPLKDSDNPFDDALIAVRESMDWLARFSAQEQNYIFPISLHALLGNNWDQGLNSDGHMGAWDFTVNTDLFPDQAHVRLRGLSLTVNTESQDCGLYQAVIRVPISSTITLLDGTTNKLDQSAVPITRVARIQRFDSQKSPDVVGALSLHNVSPMGAWRIGITSAIKPLNIIDNPKGKPTPATPHMGSKLTDVILHLYVAIRAS